MEARTAEPVIDKGSFFTFTEEHASLKQSLLELKHEISDLRKELKFEVSQIKIIMENTIKDAEMRLYQHIMKTAITAIGVLGGLQSFFHFIK